MTSDVEVKQPPQDPYGSATVENRVLNQLLNLNAGELKVLTADLKKAVSEDYTATKIEASVVDEIPAVITTLTDLIDISPDGKLKVRKDERGNWIDFIGAKGNIPSWFMKYNQKANFSSIFLRLEDGCYETEYKTDDDGSIVFDDDNQPVIERKKCTSLAVELRNLNQVCMLGMEANRSILQAKIFGGLKGGIPLGYEGNLDKMVADLIGKPRK